MQWRAFQIKFSCWKPESLAQLPNPDRGDINIEKWILRMRNPEGVTLIEFVRGCVLTNITPSGFVHSLFPFFYINVTPIGVLRQPGCSWHNFELYKSSREWGSITAEITRNPFAFFALLSAFFALLSAFFALLRKSTSFSVAEIAESGAKNAVVLSSSVVAISYQLSAISYQKTN